MNFNEKLQELRKQKGVTQEELANSLFVSRTAISKWESGRGFPNLESLKSISKYFGISIDELLSGEEILAFAEKDKSNQRINIHCLIFGLLDICSFVFFFFPLFGQINDGVLSEVSLLSLTEKSAYLITSYFVAVVLLNVIGVVSLSFQIIQNTKIKVIVNRISLFFNAIATMLFVLSSQPYPATILLFFFLIKVILLLKRH